MIPLSVFRSAVKAVRDDYEATRTWHLARTPSMERKMRRTDAVRLEKLNRLMIVCGLDRSKQVWTPHAAQLHKRVLDAVDRAAGVDWSKVYEEES